MNKFKAWLIRKLGGYVHLSEPPIIYRERPVITLHTKVLSVRNYELMPRDVELEAMEIRATNALAKLIYEQRAFTMRETFDVELNREIYEFTIDVVKHDGSKCGVYADQFDNPESFYPPPSPDYSHWKQGKDGF